MDLKLGHHARDGIEVIDVQGEIDIYTAPRTDARYDRGRIEAVPRGARRRVGLPHAHVLPRARGRPARSTSGAVADQ